MALEIRKRFTKLLRDNGYFEVWDNKLAKRDSSHVDEMTAISRIMELDKWYGSTYQHQLTRFELLNN